MLAQTANIRLASFLLISVILFILFFIGLAAIVLGVNGVTNERATVPCSTFANEPLAFVPARCVNELTHPGE